MHFSFPSPELSLFVLWMARGGMFRWATSVYTYVKRVRVRVRVRVHTPNDLRVDETECLRLVTAIKHRRAVERFLYVM